LDIVHQGLLLAGNYPRAEPAASRSAGESLGAGSRPPPQLPWLDRAVTEASSEPDMLTPNEARAFDRFYPKRSMMGSDVLENAERVAIPDVVIARRSNE